LSAARDCLCNIFPDTLRIAGRSSNRNLRKRHAVMTETHVSREVVVKANKTMYANKSTAGVTFRLRQ
jgi:hypothetical protein